jgi:hypothetical protein
MRALLFSFTMTIGVLLASDRSRPFRHAPQHGDLVLDIGQRHAGDRTGRVGREHGPCRRHRLLHHVGDRARSWIAPKMRSSRAFRAMTRRLRRFRETLDAAGSRMLALRGDASLSSRAAC